MDFLADLRHFDIVVVVALHVPDADGAIATRGTFVELVGNDPGPSRRDAPTGVSSWTWHCVWNPVRIDRVDVYLRSRRGLADVAKCFDRTGAIPDTAAKSTTSVPDVKGATKVSGCQEIESTTESHHPLSRFFSISS